jgi:RsiW-degrading membrane proteinase PrsW (M82 family)
MKRQTWSSWEFNCQYDGVVYAVFVSLGFALWENISYVMMYGFGTAIVRAVTAIPGHACFGVFMGIFYGIAKRLDYRNENVGSKLCRIFAVVIPALLHGAYDYIATMESQDGNGYFIGFVAVMFLLSYVLVGRTAKADRPIY